ncbi:hypothetical protein RclHR1_13580004 [Rhizophagus clarus]|uniref:Protein kinase domain-containing protein n=1 Tax=Rhizophagus clarus TaxID=94130 RepID=A0A2Z6QQ89_9GLOM|nr:hypothetical protein RclHR1_13580004 [Rhizophagus clarus]
MKRISPLFRRLSNQSTLLFNQKYCKNCISEYIKNVNNNITHLKDQLSIHNLRIWVTIDVIIYTDNSILCTNHEDIDFYKYEIQELRGWCEKCFTILFFKQLVSDYLPSPFHVDDNCKLCGKVIDEHALLCSDCYQISSGWIKSTLTNNSVLIIYLPWRDTYEQCISCNLRLEFTSDCDCQKQCLCCCIFYIGCRYCLTSNIIFGFTNQSQCKKCERTSFIDINMSGNDIIDKFLCSVNIINFQIDGHIKNTTNPLEIYNSLKVKCHGITKNPLTNEFMFIMKFANGGNLCNYLHDNFKNITWNEKLYILWRISDGLQTIHEKGFIHRDFYSGNILIEIIENDSYIKVNQYLIGDLGLSQPANNTLSNNEIYGVIPYIAPEVFKGAKFSKASDIYSMGMIMWELTTGCKLFANIEHDTEFIYEITDGKRPEITDDTPEDFVNLMKKCWNLDPKKRPSAKKNCETIKRWLTTKDDVIILNQVEVIRCELIESKIPGPEFKYITREYELEIYNIQRDFIIRNPNTQQRPNSLSPEINPLRKRNIEELSVEIQDNGKHIKMDEMDGSINEEFKE